MTRTRTRPFASLAVCYAIFVFSSCVSADSQAAHSGKEGYFPLSVGNSWVYSLSGRSQVRTITWSVTQREVIKGSPVFHLWPSPAQGDEPLSLSAVEAGIVEAGTERFLLKYPVRTGERWSTKSQSLRALGKLDIFEVISAGKPCSIGEHSFKDCTEIRETDEANNVVSLTTYARGVGPVKYVYYKGLHSEDVETTLTIKSWGVQ